MMRYDVDLLIEHPRVKARYEVDLGGGSTETFEDLDQVRWRLGLMDVEAHLGDCLDREDRQHLDVLAYLLFKYAGSQHLEEALSEARGAKAALNAYNARQMENEDDEWPEPTPAPDAG